MFQLSITNFKIWQTRSAEFEHYFTYLAKLEASYFDNYRSCMNPSEAFKARSMRKAIAQNKFRVNKFRLSLTNGLIEDRKQFFGLTVQDVLTDV